MAEVDTQIDHGRKLGIGLDALGDHRAAGNFREVDEARDDGHSSWLPKTADPDPSSLSGATAPAAFSTHRGHAPAGRRRSWRGR